VVYMIYTAFDGHIPKVAVTSISAVDFVNKNWKRWSKPSLITPPEVTNKDGCIIPEKTDKGYVVIHRVIESICADIFETLDFSKEKVKKCLEIIGPRQGMWDGYKVGLSTPPIKTKSGWIMLYHGVSDNKMYKVGAVLLDLKDPANVLGRTALPIFESKEPYEQEGTVPNVVFPCGNVRRQDKLFIYYGGADKVVGLATVKISELLKTLI
jgi:beta-1,2-mannobiose phosphorylase / 1,2-beta-oligomannan phosphorylase